MEFYRSCLGGELTITRLGDTPMAVDLPPEEAEAAFTRSGPGR
jgi:hypothetical protein